jgi:hypothetical protein
MVWISSTERVSISRMSFLASLINFSKKKPLYQLVKRLTKPSVHCSLQPPTWYPPDDKAGVEIAPGVRASQAKKSANRLLGGK